MIIHELRAYYFHEVPFFLRKAAFSAATFQYYAVDAPRHWWHPLTCFPVIVLVPYYESFLHVYVPNYLSDFEDVL